VNNISVTHVSYAVSNQTASFRLHNELAKKIDSKIFTSTKSVKSNLIIQPITFFENFTSKFCLLRELIISKIFPNSKIAYFSYNIGPVFFQLFWLNKLFNINTEIFHFHWIGNGFLNLNQFKKIKQPIVITLHDVWFITGGCHVNFECKKYETGCDKCPMFENKFNPFNITKIIYKKKVNIFSNKNIELIVLSQWMKDIVTKSPIFSKSNINLIPNGVNLDIFTPLNKNVARINFSINLDTKIILYGGISAKSDYNKGYDLLIDCIHSLNLKDIEIVVFGEKTSSQSQLAGYKVTSVGFLSNEIDLAKLYSAADIVIVPSRQESFSQVSLEAISCGTPVVAFDYSGPRDIITHKVNGYLAKPYDPKDLAKGIEWIFNSLSKSNQLCIKAREIAVEKFDIKQVAQSHIDLYNTILLN
jgi:glycosyltransferase involved in cell wall biosynthesis